jgi:hypothetical protein
VSHHHVFDECRILAAKPLGKKILQNLEYNLHLPIPLIPRECGVGSVDRVTLLEIVLHS